jgi:hypothetical protein
MWLILLFQRETLQTNWSYTYVKFETSCVNDAHLFRITVFLDFVHRPIFQWLRLAHLKGPNRGGNFLQSPEYGNRPSFRKIVFSSYLEFWTVDKSHKPSDSECYTPSSEPIRIYWYTFLWKHLYITNNTVSCLWHLAVWLTFAVVSEERTSSIFRAGE